MEHLDELYSKVTATLEALNNAEAIWAPSLETKTVTRDQVSNIQKQLWNIGVEGYFKPIAAYKTEPDSTPFFYTKEGFISGVADAIANMFKAIARFFKKIADFIMGKKTKESDGSPDPKTTATKADSVKTEIAKEEGGKAFLDEMEGAINHSIPKCLGEAIAECTKKPTDGMLDAMHGRGYYLLAFHGTDLLKNMNDSLNKIKATATPTSDEIKTAIEEITNHLKDCVSKSAQGVITIDSNSHDVNSLLSTAEAIIKRVGAPSSVKMSDSVFVSGLGTYNGIHSGAFKAVEYAESSDNVKGYETLVSTLNAFADRLKKGSEDQSSLKALAHDVSRIGNLYKEVVRVCKGCHSHVADIRKAVFTVTANKIGDELNKDSKMEKLPEFKQNMAEAIIYSILIKHMYNGFK